MSKETDKLDSIPVLHHLGPMIRRNGLRPTARKARVCVNTVINASDPLTNKDMKLKSVARILYALGYRLTIRPIEDPNAKHRKDQKSPGSTN